MSDISAWSVTDASNTAATPDGWPEGQAPSSVNDCGRAMMGAIKRWYDLANVIKAAKAATTSRNTTVAFANDPDLIIALPVGTYQVTLCMAFDTTGAGGGFKWQYNFTGTQTQFAWTSADHVNAASAAAGNAGLGGNNYSAITANATANGANQVTAVAIIKVTVTGSLSLQWAQSISNGNNTNLYLGSSIRAERIT